MKRFLTTAILAILCFALGATFQRWYDLRRLPVQTAAKPTPAPEAAAAPKAPALKFEHEPPWAYGSTDRPKPGDKAAPQAPPNRNLRANEDEKEQTRPRRVQGSRASYSLVDVRDGQNVIDWFPGDHPSMPTVVE